MALTRLDPKTALIVIDLQNGIVSLPSIHLMADVVHRARTLADAFRAKELPVVLVNVGGVPPGRTDQSRAHGQLPPGWSDIVPELGPQTSDVAVTKRTWGAFTDTGLQTRLKESGVTQVVVVGVATSIGVESTARQAHELGLNVTLPVDAMTDMSAEAHQNSVERIFPRLGETGSTAEVITLLSAA